jgi:aryl-alcohol dehydrogenase-like predicted oxidoreductase
VDAALGAGIDFLDTADIYGNQGGSEELLGQILKGRRDEVVLATKFGKPMGDGAERRGARDYVLRAVDASLARLRTDRVELIQHHELDEGTPLEETLGAVKELVDAGKVRAFGTSNYTPEAIRETARLAAGLGIPYVSEQSEYSWLHRDPEAELLPLCEELGLGFIPFFPLKRGLLTGKYRRGERAPEGTRLAGDGGDSVADDETFDRLEAMARFAAERRISMLDVAIGGLAAQPMVASVIAGATKPEQVRANADAGAGRPSADALAELRTL